MLNRKRDVQATYIARNWRQWQRCPRLTAYAVKFGYIDEAAYNQFKRGIIIIFNFN